MGHRSRHFMGICRRPSRLSADALTGRQEGIVDKHEGREVHPSHRMYDDGWFASDPRCTECKLSPWDSPLSIKSPCGQDITTFFWQGEDARIL
jgi:hypothetical protein